tara:strand:+ start:64258 stop:64629 length:372 start_codon:yes stop_codon:yes gene_type:complete
MTKKETSKTENTVFNVLLLGNIIQNRYIEYQILQKHAPDVKKKNRLTNLILREKQIDCSLIANPALMHTALKGGKSEKLKPSNKKGEAARFVDIIRTMLHLSFIIEMAVQKSSNGTSYEPENR